MGKSKKSRKSGSRLYDNFAFVESIGSFGIFEFDPEKEIFYGSDSFFSLLGIKERSGKTSLSTFKNRIKRKEDLRDIEKGILSLQKPNDSFTLDFKVLKSTQRKETIDLRIIMGVEMTQKMRFIKGVIQDISLDKKIEKELFKSKKKIEKSDQLKSIFLKNLSYELRGPMNSILGFSKLLNIDSPTDEQKNDYTSIIRNKGNYLLSVIDDIIELSQFELGDIKLNKSEFKISELLKEIYQEYDKLRIEKGKEHVALLLKLPEEMAEHYIYNDQGRMYQLIYNLLSNALKFTNNGRIELGITQTNKYYKIYVADTGIGLSDEEQKRIFNRFEYIEETSSDSLSGTGLSLTISKHIVELMGGKIKVKSELNEGSIFMIKIPIAAPPVKTEEKMENEINGITKINWKDKVVLIDRKSTRLNSSHYS